jgi:hypothetical protein
MKDIHLQHHHPALLEDQFPVRVLEVSFLTRLSEALYLMRMKTKNKFRIPVIHTAHITEPHVI